jgi:hypothetical protein
MIGLRKFFIALLLGTLLLTTSCAQQTVSRFEGAQQVSTAKDARAVVKNSESGSSFNRYFPGETGGYKRIYTQEKTGFAQAKLTKDGKEVATLSISDTSNNSSATDKFQQSNDTIGGYPAVNQGSNTTAVLVKNRFQVKVRAKDSSFDEQARRDWLSKFDLRGLSKL